MYFFKGILFYILPHHLSLRSSRLYVWTVKQKIF